MGIFLFSISFYIEALSYGEEDSSERIREFYEST